MMISEANENLAMALGRLDRGDLNEIAQYLVSHYEGAAMCLDTYIGQAKLDKDIVAAEENW